MARGDTLDFQILRGVSGKLEHFRSQIFEDGSDIDSGWLNSRISGVFQQASFGGAGMEPASNEGSIPLAPTRILFWVLFFKKRLTRPQGNCKFINVSLIIPLIVNVARYGLKLGSEEIPKREYPGGHPRDLKRDTSHSPSSHCDTGVDASREHH